MTGAAAGESGILNIFNMYKLYRYRWTMPPKTLLSKAIRMNVINGSDFTNYYAYRRLYGTRGERLPPAASNFQISLCITLKIATVPTNSFLGIISTVIVDGRGGLA